MSNKREYDIGIFCTIFFLVALGLIMVASASQFIAQENGKPTFYYLYRQVIRIALGLCLFIILTKVPYSIYQRRKLPQLMLFVSMILLIAIFVWGRKSRGSSRWFYFSNLNCMLQPVEVAKIALVVFLAAKLTDSKDRIKNFRRGFLPLAAVTTAMAVLVALQPNISNAIFIVMLSSLILFIGGCRLHHIVSFGIGMTAVAVPLLYKLPHVCNRINAYTNRGQDLKGLNWHTEQSLIALGSGFVFGCGPGRGHQKYSFLPDAHTDFIYSIVGEELGVFGTVMVLLAFVFILVRAVRAAKRSPTSFGYLLALGIGFSIFTTATINIAMTLGIIPTAGLPLPFMSYGGSSMVTSLAAAGILLNISSEGRDDRGVVKVLSNRRTASRNYARRVRGKNKSLRR